jgi:hypothetical protein
LLAFWETCFYFEAWGGWLTDSLQGTDIPLASAAAVLAAFRNRKQSGGKRDWAHSGHATPLDS